ncbi:MAG TPA: hypothetical protein ENN18_08395 [Proteobacteria bacterium]|nr:hypothetical protein [Pseudomonadota bacterium]
MHKLVATNWKFHPTDNLAASVLSPIFSKLSEVEFSITIGDKNSNSFDSNLDHQIKNTLLSLGAVEDKISIIDALSKEYDFVVSYSGHKIVGEIEKTNREKILYDLLKCHMYLNSGASLATLFLPTNYAHSNGVWNLYDEGIKRFDQCLRYDFGLTFYFKRILLVGFDQVTSDGTRMTKAIRAKWVKEEKN